ncbi:ribose-phosphate pyrophosphokinase, partial [Microcystis sp. M49636_WE2]
MRHPMFPAASDSNRLRLFSGSANVSLAQEVARYLGMDVGPMIRKRFADGELYIQIQESIRGCDVYLIQPCCNPVNDHLMELLIMIDACRRASARQITAVIPYYGYARADRKTAGRESIAAKLVANLITEAGASRVLAMDLHSAQIQGYFDIPFDHVYGSPVVVDYLLSKQLPDIVVVSPDVGGVARARAFAKKLNDAPLAIIDKRRQTHNVAEVMNLIGDVKDKTAVLVDDMIDTAGTIAQGAQLLKAKGARQVYACATHPVFS